jgi:hypothetical protein
VQLYTYGSHCISIGNIPERYFVKAFYLGRRILNAEVSSITKEQTLLCLFQSSEPIKSE